MAYTFLQRRRIEHDLDKKTVSFVNCFRIMDSCTLTKIRLLRHESEVVFQPFKSSLIPFRKINIICTYINCMTKNLRSSITPPHLKKQKNFGINLHTIYFNNNKKKYNIYISTYATLGSISKLLPIKLDY